MEPSPNRPCLGLHLKWRDVAPSGYILDGSIRTMATPGDAEGKGVGEIKGTMAFDRKDYGIDGSIPFIKIADRVEVTVAFQAKRVSGPPVIFDP